MEDKRSGGCVCFESRDGLYWLRGSEMRTAANLLRQGCQGEAVGFDRETLTVYVLALLRKGVRVS